MNYLGIPLKVWTAILGFVLLVCADIVSWRKAVNEAEAAHEKAPKFDWWTAIPKWIMGTVGGGGTGAVIEVAA